MRADQPRVGSSLDGFQLVQHVLVPEPSSILLLGLGAAATGAVRRRRRSS